MSFNPNIPQISNFLALSQKQILANFQAINNSFVQDHVALGLENQGMHDVLTLRPQSGDPTTTTTESALYNKLVSTVPQAFFRPSSNQTPIQLSNSNISTLATGGINGADQYTFLAGPFTMYMGYILNSPNNNTITLLPATTLLYVGISTYLPTANQGGDKTLMLGQLSMLLLIHSRFNIPQRF